MSEDGHTYTVQYWHSRPASGRACWADLVDHDSAHEAEVAMEAELALAPWDVFRVVRDDGQFVSGFAD